MLQDHSDTPFDVLMHVGDISYASVAVDVDSLSANDGGGELVGICHRVILIPWQELVWDAWSTQVEPLACRLRCAHIAYRLAAQIPYVAGVGNHEKFFNFTSYFNRFRNPSPWYG